MTKTDVEKCFKYARKYGAYDELDVVRVEKSILDRYANELKYSNPHSDAPLDQIDNANLREQLAAEIEIIRDDYKKASLELFDASNEILRLAKAREDSVQRINSLIELVNLFRDSYSDSIAFAEACEEYDKILGSATR